MARGRLKLTAQDRAAILAEAQPEIARIAARHHLAVSTVISLLANAQRDRTVTR